jgi:hypothetical protein
MGTGATAEPADRLPEGVRLWQQDGGWYLTVGEQRHGPFLYRPLLTAVWEQATAAADGGDEALVARFTRFDAAGEQLTFRQDCRVDRAGQRHLVRTSLGEAPPSPVVYEGRERPTPGAPSQEAAPERR